MKTTNANPTLVTAGHSSNSHTVFFTETRFTSFDFGRVKGSARNGCRPSYAALEEPALGVGWGELEGSPIVRESIRRAGCTAEQVGAGGVQEVVLPQARVEVEGVEEGEASIRALEKATAIARLRSTMGDGAAWLRWA